MLRLIKGDSAIVRQVLGGRQERFDELVQRHLPAVYSVAYGVTGNRADAEDVAQDAFLKAYTSLNTLREPKKFEGWVVTIARNTARRFVSKRQRAASEIEGAPEPSTEAVDAATEELHQLLRNKVESLDEPHREVLLLHYFAGKRTREIGALLDVSQAAVLKRLQRAREALGRELLGEMDDAALRPKRSMSEQSKRIGAAVGALSASWAVSGGGKAIAASMTTAAFMKAAATLVVVAGVTGGAVLFGSDGSDSLAAVDSARAIYTIYPFAEPEEVEPPDLLVVPLTPPPTETVLAALEEQEESAPVEEVVAIESRKSFDGMWRVLIGDGASTQLEELALATITQDGINLKIELGTTAGPEVWAMSGTVTDMQVTATVVANEGTLYEAILNLSGYAEPSFDAIVLRGVLEESSFPSGQVQIRLERLDEEAIDREELIDSLKLEVLRMAAAIETWVRTHGGDYPDVETAEAVYNGAVRRSHETRTVEYAAKTKLEIPPHLKLTTVLSTDSTFHPELAFPDRLMMLENELAAHWGDAWTDQTKPLLTVRYPEHEVGFYGYSGKRAQLIDDTTVQPDGQQSPKAEAQQASCASNMKQLTLSCKMFMNDVKGEYAPPGWRTIYPDYMPDPNVLRCPANPPDTVSYELLFPATAREYAMSVAAEAYGMDIDELQKGSRPYYELMSKLPFVYEKDYCAVNGVRNVVFMDGHAENFTDAEWAERIEPFFAYR